MRLLYVTSYYDRFVRTFEESLGRTKSPPFQELERKLLDSRFTPSDSWTHALKPLGYDAWQITLNCQVVQRAWAREAGLARDVSLREIAFEQIKEFRPDILWYDPSDEVLITNIRRDLKFIKLILGWDGSAQYNRNVWGLVDLVLSCAPETVQSLRLKGHAAEHLHHAFDPRFFEQRKRWKRSPDVTFVGHLEPQADYHNERIQFLENLLAKVPQLEIYSPSSQDWLKKKIKWLIKSVLYSTHQWTKSSNHPAGPKRLRFQSRHLEYRSPPTISFNLSRKCSPPVFGLDMLSLLAASKISLNVHADSSFGFASNARLFEATGMGTCLLTDWKQNLPALFEPEKEIVSYKGVEDCVEKIHWYLEHPNERMEVARRGQTRCFRDHTYTNRASQLDQIIQTALKKRRRA